MTCCINIYSLPKTVVIYTTSLSLLYIYICLTTQSPQLPSLQPRLFLDINTTRVISATATATAIGAVSLEGDAGGSLLLICAISLTFCHLGSLQLAPACGAQLISSQPQNNQRANEARKLSLARSRCGSCCGSIAAIELRHPGPVHISHYTVAQPSCTSPLLLLLWQLSGKL